MGGILELVLGVDPALDPDVSPATRCRELERFGDGHLRRRRNQPSHPEARSERPKHRDAEAQGKDTRCRQEEGSHGPDDIGWSRCRTFGGQLHRGSTAGMKGPEGTYSRRGR